MKLKRLRLFFIGIELCILLVMLLFCGMKLFVLTRLKEEKDLDRILNSDILKIENEKSFRTGVGDLTLSIGGL